MTVKDTYKKVMSANGPAQMLTYAFWGVLMAGMFQGVCDMCFPPELLILWGAISAIVVPVTIWGSKEWLRNILLVDVVVSAYILVVFLTHEPHSIAPIYHIMTIDGMATRPSHGGHTSSDWFHISALIWMSLHAMYLADLTNRQLLEIKRFRHYDT